MKKIRINVAFEKTFKKIHNWSLIWNWNLKTNIFQEFSRDGTEFQVQGVVCLGGGQVSLTNMEWEGGKGPWKMLQGLNCSSQSLRHFFPCFSPSNPSAKIAGRVFFWFSLELGGDCIPLDMFFFSKLYFLTEKMSYTPVN